VENRIRPLTFEEFQSLLVDVLHVEAAQLKPEAYFVTDLGVDSVRLVEVMLRMEALGLELSPDLVWRIQTVGEAYQVYQQQAGL
jgi:acyl carrier protein